VADAGDYFVVNVSSPNTPGLRELQNRAALEEILGTLTDAGADPLLVKLSPDLPEPAVEDALGVVDDLGLDGVIATNTTTSRPNSKSPQQAERGGLSGKPIEPIATERVRFVAERTDVPVIGVGGISDAKGAYEKIRAGASLIQLYTGLVYEGPGLARDINGGPRSPRSGRLRLGRGRCRRGSIAGPRREVLRLVTDDNDHVVRL